MVSGVSLRVCILTGHAVAVRYTVRLSMETDHIVYSTMHSLTLLNAHTSIEFDPFFRTILSTSNRIRRPDPATPGWCHIKMSPHEKSALEEIITDLTYLPLIKISPAS